MVRDVPSGQMDHLATARRERDQLAAENADLKRRLAENKESILRTAADIAAQMDIARLYKRLLAEAEGAIGYADRLPIAPGQDALWPTLPAVRRVREGK